MFNTLAGVVKYPEVTAALYKFLSIGLNKSGLLFPNILSNPSLVMS